MKPRTEAQQQFSIDFFHRVGPHTLCRFGTGSGFQIEMVSVQGADHSTVADQPFGEWTLPVRTEILSRKQSSVALTKDRDFLSIHLIAAALA